MPYYSQFKNNNFMINPAITGTKRGIDARISYRNQWTGYNGAPSTEGFSLHSRLWKGKIGVGTYLMQDNIGPLKQFNIGASFAFHLRFSDCELSGGVAGNYGKYTLDGDKILLHNTQDPAIDQHIVNSSWAPDASAGIYLYNDRFHIGLSSLHLIGTDVEFYKNDSTKKGLMKYVSQTHLTLGYNYAQNPDYIWESTFYANYTIGVPIMLDYTLRLHYKEKIFTGVSIRLNDAIALHVGARFLENFQVSYSYDFLISKLRSYSSGSHEIMIAYSFNPWGNKKHGDLGNSKFLKQKYGYLF